ncbi:hypothetical protein, unknown function [Leishmania braziliensis MHOM/BR/75/M2904]|uniref:Uncharacterized protein n=2 Tax=Leishmania braziliensis TaxID=5660 RepID=A4HN92_LEIBR|nr:hypothetical protein, unknown function [Leishmania braziliensis MHOM/BR/75/M2904]CAJ2480725.1 unnamed protein product [Leishmania braziliensis]CAJ2481045.1 unnamed protein product [Leishmania braziliensis]CAM43637.1 hypothetical protein, unknown function [Leishmania braziliensis MHOM/BR/75/M2904]SYZ69694.1 hypothetical_protein [Leishmania braziliensis MHOM/BR/75/M2904]
MTDFPEWSAGEIVEDDVGEYLDARSARAAKLPPKMRREGRIPPKKDPKLSPSPKLFIGFVPLPECESVDDDLVEKSLDSSPPGLSRGKRQLPKVSPLRQALAQPKGPSIAAKVSETALAQLSTPPLATRCRPCVASTTDVSATRRGSTAAAAPEQLLSNVTASRGSRRPNATPQNTDPNPLSPSTLRPVASVKSSKTTLPPPADRQNTAGQPSAPNKRILRVSSPGVSVSSFDSSTNFECDGSISAVAPPLSAPAEMSLPALRNQAVRARHDSLRMPFSAETPASLQAKTPSHAPLRTKASGTRGSTPTKTDRVVACNSTAPASSHIVNPHPSLWEPASGTYKARVSKVAPTVAAPASAGPMRSSAVAMSGHRAVPLSSIERSTPLQRFTSKPKSEPGASGDGYTYGGYLAFGRTVDYQSKDTFAGSQTCTVVSSVASSTDYSVLPVAYDSNAHGVGKTGPFIALPHIGSARASTIAELRNLPACTPAVPAASGQRLTTIAPGSSKHPRPSRNSVPTSAMASRTQSFSQKGPATKPATISSKTSLTAPALVASNKNNKVKEEVHANNLNDNRGPLNADKHRKSVPNKGRSLRRRGTDFEEV